MLYFEAIEKLINLTESFLRDGKLTFSRLRKNLSVISEVGDGVATSTSSLPAESYQPFMMSISKLASKLEELTEVTRKKAECLNQLRLTSLEYADVLRTVFLLARLMMDSMSCPTKQCIEEFQEVCRRKSIVGIVHNLRNLVNLSFNFSSGSSKFGSEWKNTIESLLSLLFLINTYFLGMEWDNNLEESIVLADDITNFLKTLDGFTIREESWKSEVEKLVHETQDNNVHLNNAQKADLLKETLRNMYPNYQFYVIVFNDCDIGANFAYSGNQDQLICSMKRGLCNVIVYRSLELSKATQDCQNHFSRQVESCRRGVIPHWTDYRGYPEILRNDHIQNAGFVALLRKNQNAEVRSVNFASSPEHWMDVVSKSIIRQEFVLVAGYK